MGTGHSILDTLNVTSKGGQPAGPSGKFRTKDIEIAQLYRNAGNFYSIVEIEELAGAILATGLLENLTVVYDPSPAGQYRIVSGERRWEALKLLVQQGHQEFSTATCNVRARRTQEEETIDLILANSQRVKSPEDLLQEYTTLKSTLETMRANGQQLDGYDLDSGRLRPVIAQIMHKSSTKIAQIEHINAHLIPELRAMMNSGDLKFSAAYDMSRLTPEAQSEAYNAARETGKQITRQQAADAVRIQKASEGNGWASKECEYINGPCAHWPVIKANFMKHGQLENCAGCCKHCRDRDTCPYCCEIMAAQRPAPPTPVPDPEPAQLPEGCEFLNRPCKPWPEHPQEQEPAPLPDTDTNVGTIEQEAPAEYTGYIPRRIDRDLFVIIRDVISEAQLSPTIRAGCLDLLDRAEERMSTTGGNNGKN